MLMENNLSRYLLLPVHMILLRTVAPGIYLKQKYEKVKPDHSQNICRIFTGLPGGKIRKKETENVHVREKVSCTVGLFICCLT
jgi:hypothetical protein